MAKKKPKRATEPPTWKEARRAVVYKRTKSGKPQLWRDPMGGPTTWTDYQRRLALHGYLTPRQVAAARKAIGADRYDELTKTSDKGGIAPLAFIDHAQMAENYARKQGISKSEALKSEGYWNAVENVLLPLQASKRIGMSARQWATESAFDTIEEAWNDPYFFEYVMERDRKGRRKRFADIDYDMVYDTFHRYDEMLVDYYNEFGDTLDDWLYND